jgi:hypothetical protein
VCARVRACVCVCVCVSCVWDVAPCVTRIYICHIHWGDTGSFGRIVHVSWTSPERKTPLNTTWVDNTFVHVSWTSPVWKTPLNTTWVDKTFVHVSWTSPVWKTPFLFSCPEHRSRAMDLLILGGCQFWLKRPSHSTHPHAIFLVLLFCLSDRSSVLNVEGTDKIAPRRNVHAIQ